MQKISIDELLRPGQCFSRMRKVPHLEEFNVKEIEWKKTMRVDFEGHIFLSRIRAMTLCTMGSTSSAGKVKESESVTILIVFFVLSTMTWQTLH